MKQLHDVVNNEQEVLAFLKTQYPLYHLSNVFLRDMQYGLQKMFEKKGEKLRYPEAERLARELADKLEKAKILRRIDQQSWVLHYPEFKKPVVPQAPAAKPAPGATAAKPAAAPAARPTLPPLSGAKPVGGEPAAKPSLPPLSSAKPVSGTPAAKPALPPLASSKPEGAATAKPSLPPLTSAKSAGAATKPSLPPLSSSKPPENVAAAPALAAKPVEQSDQPAAVAQSSAPKEAAAEGSAQPSQTPPGEKKGLPPLKGNYKPAGKK